MVNSINPSKSLKNPVFPSDFQDSSQYVGKSPDSSDLLSRTISKTSKWVYSRERSQTHCITRHFSRSVSASSAFRNISSEAVALFSSEKSKEKDIGSATT